MAIFFGKPLQKSFYILFVTFACSILWIPPRDSFAQDTDSLKNLLSYTESGDLHRDTTNVNYLIKIAETYSLNYPDSSLEYASGALSLAKSMNYTKGKLNANYQIGRIFFFKGNYQKVFEVADRSLKEIELYQLGFDREKALTNQLAGMAHASLGSYQPGLKYFLRAKDLFDQLEDEKGMFENMNNIGVSYLKLEDYDKALEIFLELDSLQTLEPSTISIPVNLGFIYYKLGDYQKAEEHLNRVLEFEKGTYDRRALGLTTFKLGEVYRERKNHQKAIEFFTQSIQVYGSLNNDLKKVPALNGMALAYLEQQNAKEALKYAKQALEIAENHNALPEKNNSTETLYRIYRSQGNAEQALKYHELYKSFSDSLHNNDISKEIGRLEAENEFEKRELEIRELQKQQNLENEKQVAEQQVYLVIVLALLLTAILIAYQFYRNSHIRRKSIKLLKEKNKEIALQTERLKELNEIKNHLFSIISHDLRGPLSSLSGFIELFEADALSKDDIEEIMPKIAEKFKYTSSLLNNLLNWSKSQLEGYQTNPEKLFISKLAGEVLRVLEHKAEKKSISLINIIEDHIAAFADKKMIEIVLLNLISNAVKFTPENGSIELKASLENGEVIISVTDTGVGMPEEKLEMVLTENRFYSTKGTQDEGGTGLGLMLCKDFVEKNNGKLSALSKPGKGSTFYFSLPAADSDKNRQAEPVQSLADRV